MSEKGFRVEIPVNIRRRGRAGRAALQGPPADEQHDAVPRIARLLALAHKWDAHVRRGEIRDYAAIARANGMTKGRVTQICHLRFLAPDIQAAILAANETSTIHSERGLRPTTTLTSWADQREAFHRHPEPLEPDYSS